MGREGTGKGRGGEEKNRLPCFLPFHGAFSPRPKTSVKPPTQGSPPRGGGGAAAVGGAGGDGSAQSVWEGSRGGPRGGHKRGCRGAWAGPTTQRCPIWAPGVTSRSGAGGGVCGVVSAARSAWRAEKGVGRTYEARWRGSPRGAGVVFTGGWEQSDRSLATPEAGVLGLRLRVEDRRIALHRKGALSRRAWGPRGGSGARSHHQTGEHDTEHRVSKLVFPRARARARRRCASASAGRFAPRATAPLFAFASTPFHHPQWRPRCRRVGAFVQHTCARRAFLTLVFSCA